MRYLLGYPAVVARTLAVHFLESLPGLALFVLAPAAGVVWTLASPWRCEPVPLALSGLLCVVVAFSVSGLVDHVRDRCGLRVVPRFERALHDSPNTYSSGEAIARNLQALDVLAAANGLRTLGSFGLVTTDARSGASAWCDARELATVAGSLVRIVEMTPPLLDGDALAEPSPAPSAYRSSQLVPGAVHDPRRVAQELSLLLDAATRAGAEGIGCRLVVHASSGMNNEAWAMLRAKGY